MVGHRPLKPRIGVRAPVPQDVNERSEFRSWEGVRMGIPQIVNEAISLCFALQILQVSPGLKDLILQE